MSRALIDAYDRRERISLDELADAVDVHRDLVWEFVQYGLLEPVERKGELILFEVAAALRVRSIQRLRSRGVNLHGIALILELQERVRQMRRELEWLRR